MTTEEKIDSLTPEQLDGMIIEAVGFAMLSKVNDGRKYRLAYFKSKCYGHCVTFYAPRGQKPIVTHSAHSVISGIQARSNNCLNGLDVVKF